LVADAGGPVLEIGPGLGALTVPLARLGRPLVAVEVDLRLAEHVERLLTGHPSARLVRGDVLKQTLEALAPAAEPVTVVANLPYSITTPALEWILAQGRRVRRALLMVQREYAERLTARAGGKDYGSLTVFVGLEADVAPRFRVSSGSFHPRPEVDSTVVEVTPRPYPDSTPEERELAARLARAAMGTRRKTLANALQVGLGADPAAVRAALSRSGIDPKRRGETLSIPEFLNLARAWLRLAPSEIRP
jgi:16S rRNA (adenine1518-N6/adenine1519-N6)-dimethyltransferase